MVTSKSVVHNKTADPERLRRQQLTQGCDDSIGIYIRIFRKPLGKGIVPNAKDSQLLGNMDLPIEVVAYHPGLTRLSTQDIQTIEVNALVGFPIPALTLDEYCDEEFLKPVPVDLLSLGDGGAVGNQYHWELEIPEGGKGLDCAREWQDGFLAFTDELIRNASCQIPVVHTQFLQRVVDHTLLRQSHILAVDSVSFRIRPEPIPGVAYGLILFPRGDMFQTIVTDATRLLPAGLRKRRVRDNGVVQIYERATWQDIF